jgi:hypothetical protein
MQFKFTQNLFTGYFIGLAVLSLFIAISYNHGKKIDETIVNLANKEIPSLIAASNLKRDFQAQTLQLYELYATNDESAYKTQYIKIKGDILINSTLLQSLVIKTDFVANLDQKILQQETKANQFVEIMQQTEVDWDGARSALAEFSAGANKIEADLDQLVTQITDKTQQQVYSSKTQSAQLTNIGFIFIAALVLGLIALIYINTNNTKK